MSILLVLQKYLHYRCTVGRDSHQPTSIRIYIIYNRKTLRIYIYIIIIVITRNRNT